VKSLLLIASCAALLAAEVHAAEDDGAIVIRKREDPRPLVPGELAKLGRLLKSNDLAEAQQAADALVISRSKQAVALFWEMCVQGTARQRLIALRSLGRLGQPGAEDNIFKLALGDLYVPLRLAAAEELAQLEGGEKAAARFIEVLSNEKHPLKSLRVQALQALSRTNCKAATAALVDHLNASKPELAVAAAEALGHSKNVAHAPALIAALNTQNDDIKSAAAEALEQLTGQNFRYDLVKWSRWQKDGSPIKAAPESLVQADSGAPIPPEVLHKTPLDVVVVFDTTGSMLHIWPELSARIDAVLQELIRQVPSLRLGIVKYRAADPARTLTYMIKSKPLTRDFDKIREEIVDATFGGGSGGVQLGLEHAIVAMPWRMHSRKMILLVGDTSPAEESARSCMKTIAEAWQSGGILVNTIYVRTAHGAEHMETYKALAEAGVGHCYEYNKAWRYLIDLTAENPFVNGNESPAETAKKLCAPRK